ncbi:hypothetical protein HDU99_008328 [Rhizoclosmatium hyalinum]|nr:hypothetical protein HDU99_008328 [Rhizoclosmatium hyalinum]
MTFVRYGMIVLEKDQEVEEYTFRTNPDDYERVQEIGKHNDFIAYLMIAFGFFLMMRANADFVRAKKVEAVMLAAVDPNNNA